MFDVTLKLPSVPTLVIFGCADVVNVPVTKFALSKLPPESIAPPDIDSPVNVPKLVIFG